MAEVAFAKSFLSALDSRPTKLSADHVEDPRSYPARSAYTLPRMPKPMSKAGARSANNPGQERSVTVALKSLRSPPLDVKLTSQPLGTSVLDVKTAAAGRAGVPVEKVRLLHRKKPVPDSKVLRDLLGDNPDEKVVEFTVMVMGGAAATPAAAKTEGEAASTPTAQGVSGLDTIKSEEFWEDLRGFLLQRIRDEKEANELFGMFRKAWDDNS